MQSIMLYAISIMQCKASSCTCTLHCIHLLYFNAIKCPLLQCKTLQCKALQCNAFTCKSLHCDRV
jgi:hypothetical protein